MVVHLEKIKSDQEKLAAEEQLEITKGELDSQSQRVKDLESKMKFLHGDIEDALSQFQMEIKVSNPPYNILTRYIRPLN